MLPLKKKSKPKQQSKWAGNTLLKAYKRKRRQGIKPTAKEVAAWNEYRREYWHKNKEKLLEHCREYRKRNKEKIAISQRKRYLKNRDKYLERQRKYDAKRRAKAK